MTNQNNGGAAAPRPNPDASVDQTPPLDPKDEIHARVLAMDELALHQRRAELRAKEGQLSIDELTELCAVLASLRKKKAGPPSGTGKTKKSIRTPKEKVDISKLEF